ncbi:MAG: MBOAT family protein [Oscillospiraceae bacterium]|nr:MBOAT family protein [Oscillospiraceae bacterium]
MLFASPGFLLFVVCVWLVHALTPRALRWIVLLAASAAFYAFCGFFAAVWLVFCTVITYAGALLLHKQEPGKKKKATLAVVLLMVFGLLSIFKFAGFAAQLLPSILGRFSGGLLLPLGISFYIFQSAGYLIDVYRGKHEPQRNIAKYALFVSFFPQIVQGPIGRYDSLSPQLLAGERPTADSYRNGIQLIMWGLFKKLILADRAAVLVSSVFSDPSAHGGVVSVAAAALYCVQLYCDFSGGIDITRGVAEGLGISLDQNFAQPFFAISVQDFWRRWHITLGSWMRDYVFYPLSLSQLFGRFGRSMRKVFGTRIGKLIPTLLASFIVFFVIGIWHGGSWKYIIFGFWNGMLITGAMLAKPLFEGARNALRIKEDGKLLYVIRLLRTLIIIGAGRILTRSDNVTGALIMFKKIFTSPKTSEVAAGAFTKLGLTNEDYIVMAAAFAVLIICDIMEERGLKARSFIERRHPALQVLLMVAAIAVLLYYGAFSRGYISAQFIYGAV